MAVLKLEKRSGGMGQQGLSIVHTCMSACRAMPKQNTKKCNGMMLAF